ncbi:acyltransferase [Agrobacterium tumefaciens]|uniref:Peptidoglycan/LPS O-acetylase OafA/YrhL n=1 Tax=Agrobacterium tumefaciens TaxID=358 RepID=A0AAW8LVK3_AGRTU|nr:acyltransferase [Agrobacterium tumefaciens]MDR6702996.1 peptidoglycan/LPS O-acetylase OafA/YrhL [Agrobacterium tumefaciens]
MGYIRFLLAVSVVLAHAGPVYGVGMMTGGETSVQAFFILSGFLMALVLNETYTSTSRFYWNRFSRIYSGYMVALFCALIVMYFCNDNLLLRIWQGETTLGAKILGYIANFAIFGSDLVLFLDGTPAGLEVVPLKLQTAPTTTLLALPQSWSLSIELMFYLLAPFVCRSPLKLAGIFLLAVASRLILVRLLGDLEPWNFRVFPVTLMYFTAGSLCYFLVPAMKKAPELIGKILVVTITIWIMIYDLLPASANWLLLPTLALGAPLMLETFKGKIEKGFGDMSYMIYLIHIPVLFALQFSGFPYPSLVLAITIITALPLCQVSNALNRKIRQAYPTKKLRVGLAT